MVMRHGMSPLEPYEPRLADKQQTVCHFVQGAVQWSPPAGGPGISNLDWSSNRSQSGLGGQSRLDRGVKVQGHDNWDDGVLKCIEEIIHGRGLYCRYPAARGLV